MKKIKQLTCVLISLSLFFCLLGCNSHSTQQGEIKITTATEQETQETTEEVTEPPTQENTEPETTEAVTEKVTEKPTESPTEKKTDAPAEESIINDDDEEYDYWQNNEYEEDNQEQQAQEYEQYEIEEDPASQRTVYYTKSGECYHYENPCGRGTYYECTLSDAESRGLRPCNKCVN